ncbi:unnamed protein product, partial [Prorocentrum cordatum]
MAANGEEALVPAVLWGRLHEQQLSLEERIRAALRLLSDPGDPPGPSAAAWLFEWLARGAGAAQKKFVLQGDGLRLLCDLLRALPREYPLGSFLPFLMAQLHSAVGAGALPCDQHLQAISLLLERPARSFHAPVEQAAPLFAGAAALLADRAPAVPPAELPLFVARAARLLIRALQQVQAKKAFRGVLAALPAAAALLGRAPPEAPELPTAALEAPHAGWLAAAGAVRALAQAVFEERHLEGFEALSRGDHPAPGRGAAEGEPARKRARRAPQGEDEGGAAGADAGAAYQAGLFECVSDLLAKPGPTRAGCALLLPCLLAEFACRYRARASAQDPDLPVQEGAQGRKEAVQAKQPAVPCEFWVFLQLSRAVASALDACAGEGDEEVLLARCLVDLWGHVRRLGAYRPREDPKRLQAESLDSFCALMLRRLSALGREAAREAPEWHGLVEALRLDPSPFEPRLEAAWGTVLELCPPAREKGGGAALEPHCVRLARALLRTYGELADLPSCLDALVRAARGGAAKRAARLVGHQALLDGLRELVADVSVGSAATQATRVWESLLDELQSALATGGVAQTAGGASGAAWVAALLQHVVQGVRPSERSLRALRLLLLKSFSVVGSPGGGHRPPGLDGLLLALCDLGRRLESWEVPVALRPLAGSAGAAVPEEEEEEERESGKQDLADQVESNLRMLAQRATSVEVTDLARAPVCAAGMWLALCEDRLARHSDARRGHKLRTSVLGQLVGLAAREAGDVEASAQEAWLAARREVCERLPLLTTLAARGLQRQRGCDGCAPDPMAQLASVVAPREPACWQHLLGSASAAGPQACPADAWMPAAQIWAEGGEALAQRPELRAPLLARLAELIATAAAAPDAFAEQGGALHGLHLALLELISAPFAGSPADVLAQAFRVVSQVAVEAATHALDAGPGVASRASLAEFGGEPHTGGAGRATMSGGGGPRGGGGGRATALLQAALRCLGQLSKMLAMDAPESREAAIGEAAARFSGESLQPSARKRPARRPAGGVVPAVAQLLSSGVLGGGDGLATATVLAEGVNTLCRQRLPGWPEPARQRWAAGLLHGLLSPGLTCEVHAGGGDADDAGGHCVVRLPDTLGALSGQSGCSPQTERSLELLLALFEPSVGTDGWGPCERAGRERDSALWRAFRAVHPAVPPQRGMLAQAAEPPAPAACRCAGLLAQVAAS